MTINKLICGTSTGSDMVDNVNASTDINTKQAIIDSENTTAENLRGKRGFRGNGTDANVYLPVDLNGKYTVEFLVSCPDPSILNRLIDFRHNSGTGFISISGGFSAQSSGVAYIDNERTTTYTGTDLQQVQTQGIDIVAERVTVLSSAFDSDYNNSFISDLKIYDYYTGELVHRWKFSEASDLPVNDEVGVSDPGTINNYYSGFSEQTKEPYINTFRWLAWRISQVSQTECMITHDDGYVEMETIVAPLLQSKSMIANIGVVKDYVEGVNPSFMRESSLATLRDTYGFSIVNHTESHQSIAALIAVDEQAASDEISNCQVYLNNLGFDGDYFIYALSNSANGQTRVLAESLGIKLARIPSISDWQKIPPTRALEITPISTNNIQVESELQIAFDLIDYVVANQGVIVTYNHNVQSDVDAAAAGYVNTTGITFYTQLIDRLVGVNAKTLSMKEFEEKYTNLMI